jgi:RimJ/RimL family protein N-acetyltransferase
VTQPALTRAVLEGEVAVLRPLAVGDVDAAFDMLHGRREILDWLEWNGPDTREDLVGFYDSWRSGDPDEGHDYHFALEQRGDRRFCGCFGVRFRGHPGRGDLGFWIETASWGRGLATDAIRLLTWLSFAHLDASLLYARVFAGNHASRRALEKNGFREDYATAPDSEGRSQWHMTLSPTDHRRGIGDWKPLVAEVRM